MSEVKIEKLMCRTCLSTPAETDLRSIYEQSKIKENMRYIDMLQECASYNINMDKKFPDVICNICAELITKFYEFKTKVIECERKLVSSAVNLLVDVNDIKNEEYFDPLDNCDVFMNQDSDSSDSDDEYRCDLCDKTFYYKLIEFKDHMETAHKQNPIKCLQCKRRFLTMDGLTQHIETTHKNNCKICLKAFPDMAEMEEHKETHQLTGKNKHVCQFCQKQYVDKSTLIPHMRIHTGERPYLCSDCGKSFAFKSSLNEHVRIHTGVKRYHCVKCDIRFLHKSTYRKHRLRHDGADIKFPAKCKTCKEEFQTKDTYRAHIKTHSIKKFDCSLCNRKFKTQEIADVHKLVHADGNLGKYPCDICHKLFKQPIYLIQHKRIHTGEKPYVCAICGAAFNHGVSLRDHKNSHLETRPYICTHCGKGYMRRADLNHHLTSHSDERNFLCTECGKMFKTRKHLQKHIKKVHLKHKLKILEEAMKHGVLDAVQTKEEIELLTRPPPNNIPIMQIRPPPINLPPMMEFNSNNLTN